MKHMYILHFTAGATGIQHGCRFNVSAKEIMSGKVCGVVSGSHPERVDLRAVLEKAPDLVLVFQPNVSQFTDFSQSVEGAVGLHTRIKNMTKMTNRMISQGQNCHRFQSC